MKDFNDVLIESGEHAVKAAIDTAIPSTAMGKDVIEVKKSDDETIQELATLPAIEYARRRREAAKALDIAVVWLDDIVKAKRLNAPGTEAPIFSVVEPWDSTVCLSSLLSHISDTLERFLVFPSRHESKCIALWVLHTYLMDASNISPILNVSSPEKRCGKTTLLNILHKLSYRPIMASNISSASLYRSIQKWTPTLIIDEGDTFIRHSEDLRGIINSGHTRDGAFVVRCEGDRHEPKRFSTWGAKVIAGIGGLSGTIEDRSIVVRLRRKMVDEKRESIDEDAKKVFCELARKCARFAEDNLDELRKIRPKRPSELNDRAADNWAPLLAIAQFAGNNWLVYAIDAAQYFSNLGSEPLSVSVELLQNMQSIFSEKDIIWISTEDFIYELCRDPELPWATYGELRKPITARQLSEMLKEFGIKSVRARDGDGSQKRGYSLINCRDAFARYIPQTSVTASQAESDADPEAYLAASEGV
jgi:putative DNA primase/helicase